MLHGDIKVNGSLIGQWTAVNKDNTHKQFRRYDCTLWYRGLDGYLYEAEWELWGHGSPGAIGLAERVLREGKFRAKKRIKLDDE